MSDEFVKLLRNPAFGADATDRKVMNQAADRIEHLHSMAVMDGDEIAKWREIVSGRTIGENFEAVWRERLKQSEAREAALNLKLAKAVAALEAALKYNTAMHGGAGAYNQRIKDTIAELGKDENDE